MSQPDRLNLRDAVRALEALPDEKQDAAMRWILSYCPDGTFQSAIDAEDDDRGPLTPSTRPTLLQLLEEARPFAERMVYREGIVNDHALSGTDCIDGVREVIDEWREFQVDEKHRRVLDVLDGTVYEAAAALGEADYILGIAVGLLLRLPQTAPASVEVAQ